MPCNAQSACSRYIIDAIGMYNCAVIVQSQRLHLRFLEANTSSIPTRSQVTADRTDGNLQSDPQQQQWEERG